MSRILIVEDDAYLREELIHTFEKRGHLAAGISSFTAPEQEIMESKPELVVLDLNLPGKSGFELCRWLKAHASFPVLILTSRDTLSDELHALDLGADDFLTKPCHPDRLIARGERLLQTYGKVQHLVEAGGLMLDTDTYKLIWRHAHIILPETEGRLLRTLIEHYPQLVSKQELSAAVWGDTGYVDENILQVNMTRLRKSLNAAGLEDIVRTVRGKGYILEVTQQ